ncbi:MAG TPA: hypothetical protein VK459_21800, partial [Polyangiaceae bacterium]|nr:hypothetical protein [Polyangiaceae bacterium]
MSVRPAFDVAARAAAHGRILPRLARLVAFAALAALFVALIACGGAAPASPVDPLSAMREAAAKSTNGEVVGRWLLGELLVPGGQAAQA